MENKLSKIEQVFDYKTTNSQLVSIVIPIYKVEDYLVECLDSCVNQTYKNLEIIAVNDGSPDGCGDIIEQYVRKDSRFVHLKQPNQGVATARKNGIESSHGDYIIQLDGDDFLALDSVELLLNEIVRTGADMVYADAYRWTNEGVRSDVIVNPENLSTQNGMEYLESGISTFMWAKIYSRKVSLNLITQRTNVSEDMFFNIQILPLCRKVVYLKKHLYYYRYNFASIMNDKSSKIAVQYLEHAFQRRELFDHVELTGKFKKQLLYDNIRIILRYMSHVGFDDRVKSLIEVTYKEYKFRIPKSVKEFRMTGFFILAKFYPRFAMKLL